MSRLLNVGWSRLLFAALVFALIVNVVVNAIWLASAMDGLKDLDSFLHSGAAYAKGLDPYEYYWWLKPAPISPEALNLNPPISVYLFEPLSSLDRDFLGVAFLAGAIAMIAVAVGLLMRAYPDKRQWIVLLVVVSMAGVWQMLWYLQIYAPLLLAMTGAWLLLRRGDWLLAGILIGVVIAIKPNYGLVALVMVASGHYRPAAAALVTAALISLVPVLVDGPHIYWQWLHLTRDFDGYGWTSNASLVSVGERLSLAPVGKLAAVALAGVVLLLARRWRPDTLTSTALGTMCVILVGPVSWAGYTLLLLPFLFSMQWDRLTWLSVALLVMPFAPGRAIASLGLSLPGVDMQVDFLQTAVPGPVLTLIGAVVMPLVGAIYAWAVLLLLVRLCQRLAAERGDRLPAIRLGRLWRPSPVRRAQPLRPRVVDSRSRGSAMPARVRSDIQPSLVSGRSVATDTIRR